jgi:DNA primase
MTVPLMDQAGQVIGFTGRILRDEPNAPKYLNTPQTLLYDKSRHVFGLSQAKEAIRKQDEAVIVEGNLDVVSSHQAGVKNVVATAGTAITDGHLRALNRLSGNVKLAFDGDKAGLAATERAIPIAQAAGVELSIVSLPGEAKDPDELIKQSVELWQSAIKDSRPVVDWVLEQFSDREDMASAAGKRRFTTDSIAIIKKLDDAVETEHYLRKVAEMTDSSIESIMAKVANQDSESVKPLRPIAKSSGEAVDSDENTQEDILLGIMVAHPVTRGLLASFNPDLITNPARKKLLEYVKANQQSLAETPAELKDIETYVKIVELKAETRYGTWQESDIQLEAARLLRQIEVEQKKKTTETLMNELREAELEGDDKRSEELRTKLTKLIKETARG